MIPPDIFRHLKKAVAKERAIRRTRDQVRRTLHQTRQQIRRWRVQTLKKANGDKNL